MFDDPCVIFHSIPKTPVCLECGLLMRFVFEDEGGHSYVVCPGCREGMSVPLPLPLRKTSLRPEDSTPYKEIYVQ